MVYIPKRRAIYLSHITVFESPYLVAIVRRAAAFTFLKRPRMCKINHRRHALLLVIRCWFDKYDSTVYTHRLNTAHNNIVFERSVLCMSLQTKVLADFESTVWGFVYGFGYVLAVCNIACALHKYLDGLLMYSLYWNTIWIEFNLYDSRILQLHYHWKTWHRLRC